MVSTNVVTVGCKLPNGLILRLRDGQAVLKGAKDSRIVGGYGLTSVPADLWDAWLSANEKSDLVKNRIVFAQTTVAKAQDQAKEQESVKTGLEPLDPAKASGGVEKLGS